MAAVEPQAYSNVVAFLATAGVVVPLFNRLKISPILGFLLAGVALGPQGLGRFVIDAPWLDYFTVSKPGQIADIAELGVVFLLFMIGLELSWERLRLMRRLVFGLGPLQTFGGGAAIGVVGVLCGLNPLGAFALGGALAMSSTAVGVPVMTEAGRLHAPSGRAVFSVLLFQDLAVAPILIALSLIAGAQDGPHPFIALGTAVVGLVGIVVVGRLVLRPLFRTAARGRHQEFLVAASLLVVIGAGLVAELLGLSMALGALAAGLLLAETEYRHEVEVLIGPFKDLLLGLFFVSVGLGMNVSLLLAAPVLVLGVAAGMILFKAIAGTAFARLFGLKSGEALESGLMLAAGGEFAFVIIDQARGAHLLSPMIGQAMVLSATLSMFAIPALGALGARLAIGKAAAGAAAKIQPPETTDEIPRVLVVGYGRVGRLVGEMLDAHQIPWLAIDRSVRSVEAGRAAGHMVYFGDASRPELLERCGLASAKGVVLTTDEPEAAEAVAAAVRRLRPDAVLVARARDARHARRLYELGATDAVPETIEASLQLSEAMLVDIGVPMGLVIASIHEKRDEIRKSLSAARPAPRFRAQKSRSA